MDEINTYSVYVQTDANSNIINVNSSFCLTDISGWLKVDEGSEEKHRLPQGRYFDKPIITDKGVYRYVYDESLTPKYREKTDAEISAEEAALPVNSAPTTDEQLEALATQLTDAMSAIMLLSIE
jgi:hypothetical protein